CRRDRRPARRRGREPHRPGAGRHGAHRTQRRRQDVDDQGRARPRRAHRRHRAPRRRADPPRADPPHRAARRRLRARGPRGLHPAHGRGEPAPRRARDRRRTPRPRRRPLPRPRAPRPAAGREPVRRAAADAVDGPCAAQPQPAAARRRAHQGPRAQDRPRGHGRAARGRAHRADPPRRADPPGHLRARRGRRRPRRRSRRPHRPGPRAPRRRGRRQALPGRPHRRPRGCGRRRHRPGPRHHRRGGPLVSTVVLLLITGIGLGALYFLVASGLSLIYGLMHVLNFAHGAFLTLGAFAGFEIMRAIGATTWTGFALGLVLGALAGAAIAALSELLLIRPLYRRHIEQVLVTVGLGLLAVALYEGTWGTDPVFIPGPPWLDQTTSVLGARVPN